MELAHPHRHLRPNRPQPNNIHPTANAVESGPKTITLTITDTNGRTNTTDVTIEIVEDVASTEYSEGPLTAGQTYIIGDEQEWALITLPAGLDLEFEGVTLVEGEYDTAYFSDTLSGSMILLDWNTGSEVYREVLSTGSTARSRTDRRRRPYEMWVCCSTI